MQRRIGKASAAFFNKISSNYEPNNCRWITQIEQLNNRSNTHFVTYDGEVYTSAQFSRKFNIPLSTVLSRDKRKRDLITGGDRE